jgi:hypothetical protein
MIMAFRSGTVHFLFLAIQGLTLSGTRSEAQPVPNRVTTTTYNNEYDATQTRVVHSFLDGLGREIRTVDSEEAGDRVSGSTWDNLGRLQQVSKVFYSTSHFHGWKSGADILGEANAYYNGSAPDRPNGGGKAFAENEYYPDPLGRIRRRGAPGLPFSLAQSGYSKLWNFGIANPVFISNPSESSLDAKPNDANSKYRLSVLRDPNGSYFQEVRDAFGNIIKTFKDPVISTSMDDISTQTTYDILGNPLRLSPPGVGGPDASLASLNGFASDGTRHFESHPDAGRTDFVFDRAGRLRFFQSEVQRSGSDRPFNYKKYDRLDRIIEEGTVSVTAGDFPTKFTQEFADDPDYPAIGTAQVKIHLQFFYDRTDGLATKLGIPQSYLWDSNIMGKLVAQVAFNHGYGEGTGFALVETHSYDEEGQLGSRHIHMPISSSLAETYGYDLQGRISFKQTETQGTSPRTKSFLYNRKGQLVSMLQDGGPAVDYSYNPTGLLTQKLFYRLWGGEEAGRVTNSYNIRDWLVKTKGSNTIRDSYEESLFYESGSVAPRFNGNVTRAQHLYIENNNTVRGFNLNYAYDKADRLLTTDFAYANYQESYGYDPAGRLLRLREGSRNYGPYDYDLATNRLLRIANHPTRSSIYENFVYDPNGNMVFDRSKKMAVQYDWRNMPVRFIFYSDLSAYANTTPHWTNVGSLGVRRSVVDMAYDANGKRLFKQTTQL